MSRPQRGGQTSALGERKGAFSSGSPIVAVLVPQEPPNEMQSLPARDGHPALPIPLAAVAEVFPKLYQALLHLSYPRLMGAPIRRRLARPDGGGAGT